ncbi:unnamed protein product, partial [Prorocentrum cordatum]
HLHAAFCPPQEPTRWAQAVRPRLGRQLWRAPRHRPAVLRDGLGLRRAQLARRRLVDCGIPAERENTGMAADNELEASFATQHHGDYLSFLDQWCSNTSSVCLDGRLGDTALRVALPLARRVAAALPPGLARRVAYETFLVHQAYEEECLAPLSDYADAWREAEALRCPDEGWEPSRWAPRGTVGARGLLADALEAFLERRAAWAERLAEVAATEPWLRPPARVRGLPAREPVASRDLVHAAARELALHCRAYELLAEPEGRAHDFLQSLGRRFEQFRLLSLPLLERHWRRRAHSLLEVARAFSLEGEAPSLDDWLLLHYDVSAGEDGFPEARRMAWQDPRPVLGLRRRCSSVLAVASEPGTVAGARASCARASALPELDGGSVLVLLPASKRGSPPLESPAAWAVLDWALLPAGSRDAEGWLCRQELLQGWRYSRLVLAELAGPPGAACPEDPALGRLLAAALPGAALRCSRSPLGLGLSAGWAAAGGAWGPPR